ncbi:MAG: CehA/McbA family metallohydrolase [Clostridia bacterium]
MNYFATELHCHTRHSDGDFDVETLLAKAKQSELDAIALTDHNTTSCFDELSSELQNKYLPTIKGIEWTTFFGHMLVLGCSKYVDWRTAEPDTIDEYIADIKNNGGIVGLAHPFDLGSPMCTGGAWDFHIKDFSKVNYIEVWHEDFPSVKTPNQRTKEFWQNLLDKGYKIPLVYGKDWHNDCFENNPCGCTYLAIDEKIITPELAIQAIKDGRTAVTMANKFVFEISQKGKPFYIGDTAKKGKVTVSIKTDEAERRGQWGKFAVEPKKIKLVAENGKVEFECDYKPEISIDLNVNCKFLRAELSGRVLDKNCEIALTSPIYFE